MYIENQKFFEMVINLTEEGGTYIWPAEKEVYTVVGGKLIPSNKSGYKKISKIVTANWLSTHVKF